MPNTTIRLLDTIPNDTIILEPDSHLVLVALIETGWEGQRHFKIEAPGKNARCECLFFILGKGSASFSAKIEAIHNAPATAIKTKVRVALAGSAAVNIEGLWRVENEAVGADTYFSHHTLLLSDNASVKTAPYLEIRTDEVKAGHAASIGKVDEEALFYLLSRGLSEKEARTLLIEGFFETELATIDDEKIVNKIREAVGLFLSGAKNEK